MRRGGQAPKSAAAGPRTLRPWPHQRDAIRAIRGVLARASRTKLVMACGSGKTLVEFAAAADYDKVLVLEPSLALIAQSLSTARDLGTVENRAVLCVCSDGSVVGSDDWRVSPEDLGIPVTTDLIETRRGLEASKRLLVFCTYQSAPLLMEALPTGFRFDFVVYDEAHRTAGARERLFSKALSDEGLPARKRLFATATPRHMSPSARGGLDANLVYSMDDEAVYGELAYQLTLPDAIERGVCSDYEVLVSCVSGREAKDAIRKGHELLLPQPEAPVDEVAMQLAIARACSDTGARRVISFHRTIEDAQDFAEDRAGVFEDAGITAFHINGGMPAATRAELLAAFVNCETPALLTNARCLTEGVDVPSIDMVSFCFRKQSQVDIVQAVGRALRAHPGKKTGYILLPVFLDAIESDTQDIELDEVVSRSDFSVTWDVLHNVLESDASLVSRMQIARREIGYKGDTPARRVPKLRVLAAETLLKRLENDITIRAVRRLAPRWDEVYGALTRYYERHGTINDIPKSHVENGFRLQGWLNSQRHLRSNGRLSQERIDLLSKLGLFWRANDERFGLFIDDLKAFHEEHGHFHVPCDAKHAKLRQAIKHWRCRARSGQLSAERMAVLDAVGLPMSAEDEVFGRYLIVLRGHIAEHGSARAPRGTALNQYLAKLRKFYRDGVLPARWKAALDEIGYDVAQAVKPGRIPVSVGRLDADQTRWDERVIELKAYLKGGGTWSHIADGHSSVPSTVAGFVLRQRILRTKGLLSAERVAELESLGIRWTRDQHRWDRKLEELRVYREARGHQRVSAGEKSAHGLAQWIHFQRVNRERGRLTDDQIAALDRIGFAWSKDDERWEYFARLLAEQPSQRPEALVRYLNELKRHFIAGNLPEARRQRLVQLGVGWAAGDPRRAEMLRRLEILARKVGTKSLSANLALDLELKRWVGEQRRRLASGSSDYMQLTALEARVLSPAGSTAAKGSEAGRRRVGS